MNRFFLIFALAFVANGVCAVEPNTSTQSISQAEKNAGVVRDLASIPSKASCDPSTTTNTVIHTGDAPTLVSLQSSNDGFVGWSTSSSADSYQNSAYIATSSDPCKGIGFHWTIDTDQESIQIAVAVQIGASSASSNNGWAAIGFSENGGMRGADVVYYTASSDTITDAYVLDVLAQPSEDASQDWELVDSTITSDGYLIFEAKRDLDTKDAFDRKFVDDTDIFVADHRLIGAWGSSPTIMYHGFNRVRSSIQLFNMNNGQNDAVAGAGVDYDNFLKEMADHSDGSAVMVMDNYDIPTDETTYEDVCFDENQLKESGLIKDDTTPIYMVGFEFIIKPESIKYMHHILVYGQFYGCNTDLSSLLVAWTPGEDFLAFPSGTGMLVGGPNGFKGLKLQYHVDNSDGDVGKIDTGSGVRIYYSDSPVEHEIGLFQLGDPLLQKSGDKIGSGLTQHIYTCPSTCTEDGFTISNEITIVKENLHMHNFGKRMVSQLVRDDAIVHESYIDHWDFDQTGMPAAQKEPFKAQKGDTFRTICYFDGNPNTVYGQGSGDEMCIVFMLYFPKQAPEFMYCGFEQPQVWGPRCSSTFDSMSLDNEKALGRVFANSDLNLATLSPTPSNSVLSLPPTPSNSVLSKTMSCSCILLSLLGMAAIW